MVPSNIPADQAQASEALGRTAFLGRAVRDGDRAAFTELFERVVPALFAWIELRARRSTPRRIDTQDVLQEVWLRAYQLLNVYDPSRSFRAWILGIAKNVLLQSSERRTPAALGDESIPDSVTSVSLRFAKDELVQRFLSYVEDLAPEDRALLLYCGIEEYTAAQAAERLGISAEAAGKRWQTLRARLRQSSAVAAMALGILD